MDFFLSNFINIKRCNVKQFLKSYLQNNYLLQRRGFILSPLPFHEKNWISFMAGLSLSKDKSKSTDTDNVKFFETVIFPIKQSPSMLVEWAPNNFLFDRYQMFFLWIEKSNKSDKDKTLLSSFFSRWNNRDFPLLRGYSCFVSLVARLGQKFNRLAMERTFVNILVRSLYYREPKNIL